MKVKRKSLHACKVLIKVLNPWRKKGIFTKYVLLIDEMDKLPPEEVLNFLGASQKLFEKIYDEYGFVAFLTGIHGAILGIIGGAVAVS